MANAVGNTGAQSLLADIRHPFIIRFFGSTCDVFKSYMLVEVCVIWKLPSDPAVLHSSLPFFLPPVLLPSRRMASQLRCSVCHNSCFAPLILAGVSLRRLGFIVAKRRHQYSEAV